MASVDVIWDDIIGDEVSRSGPADDIEIKDLDEVKLTSRIKKTPEELARLTIDESLSRIDRAKHILKNGTEAQKYSVIDDVCRNLFSPQDSAVLLNSLIENSAKDSPTFQIYLAKVLAEWFPTCSIVRGSIDFMLKAVRKHLESRTQNVQRAYMEMFPSLIPHLNQTLIESEIIPEALLKSGMTNPIHIRAWACAVLGKICTCFNATKVETLLLDKLIRLCQDTDLEIRLCMATQLINLCRGLGPVLTKSYLIIEYMELVQDEETRVADAALPGILELLEMRLSSGVPFLDKDTRVKVIMPAIKKLCIPAPSELLCREFGKIMVSLQSEMSNDDLNFMVNWYLQQCQSEQIEMKLACAYNVPAIAHLLYKNEASGAKTSINKLTAVISTFATDPAVELRQKMASMSHILCTEYFSDAFSALSDTYRKILHDSDSETSVLIFENLDTILNSFSKDPSWSSQCEYVADTMSSSTHLFSNHLYLSGILQVTRNHLKNNQFPKRCQEQLFKQWHHFHRYFAQDNIVYHVVPGIITLFGEEPSLTAQSAHLLAHALATYMKNYTKMFYRELTFTKIQDSLLSSSHNFRHRIIFLVFVEQVIKLFSSKFFVANMWALAWSLHIDHVTSVRYKLATLIPQLMLLLVARPDKDKKQAMEQTIRTWMAAEKDKGILKLLKALPPQITQPSAAWIEADQQREAEETAAEEEDRKREKDIQGMKELSRKMLPAKMNKLKPKKALSSDKKLPSALSPVESSPSNSRNSGLNQRSSFSDSSSSVTSSLKKTTTTAGAAKPKPTSSLRPDSASTTSAKQPSVSSTQSKNTKSTRSQASPGI